MARRGRATYVAPQATRGLLSRRNSSGLLACLLAFFLLTTLSLGTAFSVIKPTAGVVAHADDAEDALKKAKSASGVNSDEDFQKLLNDIDSGKVDPEKNRESFAYIVKRVLYTGYLNYTPLGTPGGENATKPADGYNCKKDNSQAGTPLYHNCDVPNFMTEFIQQLVQLVSPMGFDVAGVTAAKSDDGFGVPTVSIPGGTVPLDYASKATKYTGLEALGYSMHYTSYRGEWDNISVMNSARALANFGLMDNIHLGVDAAVNGIKGAASGTVGGAKAGYSQGGIIGGIAGAFTGFWKGAAANVINTLLDSSDLNVFNSYAWYRNNYGATLYNARELDQTELSRLMTEKYLDYVNDESSSSSRKPPADFEALKAGPTKPVDPISKCVIAGKEVGSKTNPLTQEACETQAASQNTTAQWSKDGNGKGQTLAEWWTASQSTVTAGKAKGIDCPIDTSVDGTPAERQDKLTKFYVCWESKWSELRNSIIKDDIVKNSGNRGLVGSFFDFFTKKPEANFNAPWSRYVCTDDKGKDLEAYPHQFLYDKNGNKASVCKDVRPPIQNGYFGNGYGYTEKNPGPTVDTRRSVFQDVNPLALIFDFQNWGTTASNFLLSGTAFFTKVANGALDLAFSPIMTKLGIGTTVANIMESFRESVYFSLIVVLMAISAVTAFAKGAFRGDYRGVLLNVGYILMVFFVGVMVMADPMRTVKFVDETPAMVERAVAGTIFSVGGNDSNELCSATGTVGSVDKNAEDLNGGALTISPQASVRTMECEVWRTFLFNPYVQGQWGTGYNNLASDRMTNTNSQLVGNGGVPLGAGVTERNWALYQARVLASGTATTTDPSNAGTTTPRDLYRVVDMQAGPNNGAGRDATYFNSWSGQDYVNRVMVSLVSFIAAILGAVVIIVYAVEKIKVTFLSIILLMFLPFILLIAPNPTFGKVNLKKYLGTIGGLMVHRVMLVILLAVMMKLLTAVSIAGAPSLMGMILTIGILLYFLDARHTMLDLVNSSVANASGGQFITGKQSMQDEVKRRLPRSISNRMNEQRAVTRGAVRGAMGGLIVEGPGGVVRGATRGMEANRRRQHRAAVRQGLGALQIAQGAQQAGARAAQAEMRHKREQWRANSLQTHTNVALRDLRDEDVAREREAFIVQRGRRPAEIEDFDEKKMQEEPLRVDLYDPQDYKDMGELDALTAKLANLEEQVAKGTNHKALRKARQQASTTGKVEGVGPEAARKQGEKITQHNEESFVAIAKVKKDISQVHRRMYSRHMQEREGVGYSLVERQRRNLQAAREELRGEAASFREAMKPWEATDSKVLEKGAYFAPGAVAQAEEQPHLSREDTVLEEED